MRNSRSLWQGGIIVLAAGSALSILAFWINHRRGAPAAYASRNASGPVTTVTARDSEPAPADASSTGNAADGDVASEDGEDGGRPVDSRINDEGEEAASLHRPRPGESIAGTPIFERPESKGGGKGIDFVIGWCEPKDLLILRELADVKEVDLHRAMGDDHLASLRGIETMEILYAGHGGTGRAISVIATMPELRILGAGPLDREGLSYLQSVPHLEKLNFTSSVLDPAAYEPLGKLERLRSLRVTLEGEVTDDLLLSLLDRVPEIRFLYLSVDSAKLTDRGIAAIWGHEGLRRLHLKLGHECKKLTPESFAGIRRLSGLKELWIHQLPPALEAPRTIEHVSSVSSLEELHLPWIDNEAMAFPSRLQQLRMLYIDLPVLDEHLDPSLLGDLPKLEILDFNGGMSGSIPQKGVAALPHFPALKELDLTYAAPDRCLARVTDRELEQYVSKLSGLEVLLLAHQPITDKGLQALSNLEHLRRLDLNGTLVTEEARRKFAEETMSKSRK